MSTGKIVGDFHVGGKVTFVPTYTGGDTSHTGQTWYVYTSPSGGSPLYTLGFGSTDNATLVLSDLLGNATNDSSLLLGKYLAIEVEFDVSGVVEFGRYGPIGPGFSKRAKKVYRRYFDENGNRI